jgi:hypothetical protein
MKKLSGSRFVWSWYLLAGLFGLLTLFSLVTGYMGIHPARFDGGDRPGFGFYGYLENKITEGFVGGSGGRVVGIVGVFVTSCPGKSAG